MAISLSEPLHPGEVLREDYLVPLRLTAGRLAKVLGVPRTRIERIVKQEVGITTDTALRLSRYFDTTADFWMNLQIAYDLRINAEQLEDELARITPRQHAEA
jgi:addiction module HigA family antidote